MCSLISRTHGESWQLWSAYRAGGRGANRFGPVETLCAEHDILAPLLIELGR